MNAHQALSHNGKTYWFYIPNDVMQVLDDKSNYRKNAHWQQLTDMAVVLFVDLTALDTVPTDSGRDSSFNDDNWRGCQNEDEIERARRYTRAAAANLGMASKSGRKR